MRAILGFVSAVAIIIILGAMVYIVLGFGFAEATQYIQAIAFMVFAIGLVVSVGALTVADEIHELRKDLKKSRKASSNHPTSASTE